MPPSTMFNHRRTRRYGPFWAVCACLMPTSCQQDSAVLCKSVLVKLVPGGSAKIVGEICRIARGCCLLPVPLKISENPESQLMRQCEGKVAAYGLNRSQVMKLNPNHLLFYEAMRSQVMREPTAVVIYESVVGGCLWQIKIRPGAGTTIGVAASCLLVHNLGNTIKGVVGQAVLRLLSACVSPRPRRRSRHTSTLQRNAPSVPKMWPRG